jgi:rubrerythrin
VALEADLGGFFYTAADRHERGIFQLDLQEEDEVLEQFDVLEEKELGIALGEEAEVEQAAQAWSCRGCGCPCFGSPASGFQP